MIKKETKIVEKEESSVTAYQCDRCKTWFDIKEDWDEAQEFHHINFTGGYGSVFGDGSNVKCDICQYCLKKMIKDYINKDSVEEWTNEC